MKLKRNQKSSLVFLIFAGVILAFSLEASLGTFSEPGSGLLPFLAALLLALVAGWQFFVSRRRAAAKEKPIFSPGETSLKNLGATLGALVAFPFSLSFLGFNLTVFGFLLFLTKIIEPRTWTRALLFSGITAVTCYLLLVHWLKFSLDRGILGF